jgi:hypothetical protein
LISADQPSNNPATVFIGDTKGPACGSFAALSAAQARWTNQPLACR